MPTAWPEVDRLVRAATGERRLLRLRYGGERRIVEPHDYGLHKGVIKLLAYQIGGASSAPIPNRRWMETDLITGVEVLDQTFVGGRGAASGKHHKWDGVFARVKQLVAPNRLYAW